MASQYNIPIYNFTPDKNPPSVLTSLEACLMDAIDSKEQSPTMDPKVVLMNQNEYFKARIGNSIEELLEVYAKQKKNDGTTKNTRGYIKRSDAEALTVTTATIPASFSGLEAVMVPTRLEEQLFRVVEVVEDEDCVTITARHVWYDNLQNYTTWKPNENTRYRAGDACRNVLSNAISPCGSRVATDCTDEIVGKELDFERKNLVEAFLDPEKGICAQYGLSLIRNNWDFYVLKNVGYDRGIVIQNGKNLLGVERRESVENLATRVVPYAKSEKGDELIWLNNNGHKWLDSSHVNEYSYPRVELYDTGLQIGKDDVTLRNVQEKLLAAAQKHYSDDKVDLPEVEMTIEFLSLGDTEEYAQYRDLDKVYLYDILTVVDTVRGYSYTAQVVGVEHDLLTGMLLSVTIGELNNWDGRRKIASWQVPEINGNNIRIQSIMSGAFAPGAISGDDIANNGVRWVHLDAASIDQLTTQQLTALNANIKTLIAGSLTADDIAAGSITADRINAEDLAAAFIEVNVLEAAIAAIAEAEIGTADIGFAQIKALTAESLIAHDAVTDKYFIDKLAVRSAQMVQATVGELIVKASNDHYYRLDINAQGALVTADVTSTLTNAEIAAGVTSDGHSAIIETDLDVADLSASNMKAINALIDKLTASRIDVDELFARQATITALNTVDIRGNQYLQLMVAGYGTTYTQWADPASQTGNTVKDGDVWYKGQPMTHAQMASYTHAQLAAFTHKGLEGYQTFLRKNGAWVLTNDPVEVNHTVAMIGMETNRIALLVNDAWTGVTQLNVRAGQIEARVTSNEGSIAALALQANQFSLGLTNAQGDIVNINGSINNLSGTVSGLSGTVSGLSGDVSDLEDDLAELTISVGNKYGVINGITINTAGVAVNGQKYIKLDVNQNNYVHIDQNGLDIKGNRIKVNGKYVFDREDIIIMNPNSTEVWRRTVAGIESQMAGKHDWVLIRPYYDAKLIYNYLAGYVAQATSVGSRVVKLDQESGLAASFGTATTYTYKFKCSIPPVTYPQLGLVLNLANNQALNENLITTSQTVATGSDGPNNCEFTIVTSINLCGENKDIWFKLEGVGRNQQINDISLTCLCDATTQRVPCTTYYYV